MVPSFREEVCMHTTMVDGQAIERSGYASETLSRISNDSHRQDDEAH